MKKLFNIKVNKLAFKAPPESKQAVMMMKMEMRKEERWKRHDTKFLINTLSLSLKLCGFVFHSRRMIVDEALARNYANCEKNFSLFLVMEGFFFMLL